MVVHIREREPARVLHRVDGQEAYQTAKALTARRFMGTLLHPVSAGDMQRHFGLFRPGYKIIVDWPEGADGQHPVCGGDQIEVGSRTFPVYGSIERPGCYLDIYVGEA